MLKAVSRKLLFDDSTLHHKKLRNSNLADHLVTTLQMLSSQYPRSGIIMGGDRNHMDIRSVLNCGLKLKQCVDKPTRHNSILDVIIMNTYNFYNSPIIVAPVEADDPLSGVPSDHHVPIAYPHTDRYQAPLRNYRSVTYRPLPESGLRSFGQWIVNEKWDVVKQDLSPTEQVSEFESLLLNKLNLSCPEKTVRISSQDKQWITSELKSLDRKKSREYQKKGKSLKYRKLAEEFKAKYKSETDKYLKTNVDVLKECKPGQVYKIFKRMGAQPGDCSVEEASFNLPNHIGLSDKESAEKIAIFFSSISQEYPGLDVNLLPKRVQDKLLSESSPPVVGEYEVYRKLVAAKKPRSGIPNDIPKGILKEFTPELANPLCLIINNIIQSSSWPDQWKMEWVTPISKVPNPQSENDLRPISLTSFCSKVTEKFVVEWLLHFIGDKIDFR